MSGTPETKYKVHSTSTLKKIKDDGTPNTTVKKVKVVKLLYLLFWVTGENGDPMYRTAPQTRMDNIRKSKNYDKNIHKVLTIEIEDISVILDKIPGYIERFGGKDNVKIKEVSIHSHAGQDGPIGSVDVREQYRFPNPSEFGQMMQSGWASIDFNWSENCPRFIVYGCDSALTHPSEDHPNQDPKTIKNFAYDISKLSNFKNVEVWGQSTKSAPSYLPDYRITSIARDVYSFHGEFVAADWKMFPTYQIAAHLGGGKKATYVLENVDPPESLLKNLDKAEPMNCYKNGELVMSVNQGYFNDHRKQGTL